MKPFKDPFEAAFEEQDQDESPPESPIPSSHFSASNSANPLEAPTNDDDNYDDDDDSEVEAVNASSTSTQNIMASASASASVVPVLPKAKENEDEEEEEENMDVELDRLPSGSDPNKMDEMNSSGNSSSLPWSQASPNNTGTSKRSASTTAKHTAVLKHQKILSQFSEEQMNRYESFRRSGFQKATMKRLLVSITGTQQISVPVTIVMSGIAKMFVGELVETARVVMMEREESGPIRPCHIREAYRRVKLEGKVPKRTISRLFC